MRKTSRATQREAVATAKTKRNEDKGNEEKRGKGNEEKGLAGDRLMGYSEYSQKAVHHAWTPGRRNKSLSSVWYVAQV